MLLSLPVNYFLIAAAYYSYSLFIHCCMIFDQGIKNRTKCKHLQPNKLSLFDIFNESREEGQAIINDTYDHVLRPTALFCCRSYFSQPVHKFFLFIRSEYVIMRVLAVYPCNPPIDCPK